MHVDLSRVSKMQECTPTLVTRINLMISSSNNPSSKIPPIKEIEIIHGRLLVGQPKKDKSKRHRGTETKGELWTRILLHCSRLFLGVQIFVKSL